MFKIHIYKYNASISKKIGFQRKSREIAKIASQIASMRITIGQITKNKINAKKTLLSLKLFIHINYICS